MQDVREIDGKYITRKKELTHWPISYIQGCLVKRSYNVFLQETALFPYFQTQQLILLSISIAKNIRWEKTSLFFTAACVEEPPWHAAPIQHCLLLCPVLKRPIKWSANAIHLGLGRAGGGWGRGRRVVCSLLYLRRHRESPSREMEPAQHTSTRGGSSGGLHLVLGLASFCFFKK